jgi:hypothetical protein
MPTYKSTFENTPQFVGGLAPQSEAFPTTVSIRPAWGDFWQAAPDIIPHQLTWSSGGARTGNATFLYRYGKRVGEDTLPPASWSRWFSKVEFDGRLWIGQIDASATNFFGSALTVPAGAMTIVATSMESMFHHDFVKFSRYIDVDRAGTPIRTSFEGLTFNKNSKPNKFDGLLEDPAFARESSSVFWSTRDIVRYALNNWVPLDPLSPGGNSPSVPVFISDADLLKLPNWDKPVVQTHGFRPIEVLNRLVSRRRLLMWWLEYDTAFDVMYFRTATTTSTAVGVSPNFIPGNTNIFRLDVGGDAGAAVVIEEDANSIADQVYVQGAPRRTCFSLGFTSGPQTHVGEAKWDSGDEESYENGGVGQPNYPAAAKRGQRRLFHAAWRARPGFRDVFSTFGLDLGLPLPPDDPTGYECAPFELQLMPTLPLLGGADYGGTAIADGTSTYDNILKYAEMAPLVFLKVPTINTTLTAAYIDSSKVGRQDDVPSKDYASTYDFTCHLTMIPDEPSFRLEVRSDHQHVLAAAATGFGTFDAQDEDKGVAAIDWREMVATVAIEEDRYTQWVYPALPAGSPPIARVLRINAGDSYRLDYVTPNTVVDVDVSDGSLIKSTGGFFRDDTPQLQAIAVRAYAYYGQLRGILRFTSDYRKPETVFDPGGAPATAGTTPLRIGMFIERVQETLDGGAIYSRTVNSVVTEVTMAFPIIESERPVAKVGRPRFSLTTSFGELDPAFFVAGKL